MREEQRDGEDAERVGERFGPRPGEAIARDLARGGDQAFGGEPGREQAHAHGEGAERAARDEVVGIGLRPAPGPHRQRDLGCDIGEDQHERECDGDSPLKFAARGERPVVPLRPGHVSCGW